MGSGSIEDAPPSLIGAGDGGTCMGIMEGTEFSPSGYFRTENQTFILSTDQHGYLLGADEGTAERLPQFRNKPNRAYRILPACPVDVARQRMR